MLPIMSAKSRPKAKTYPVLVAQSFTLTTVLIRALLIPSGILGVSNILSSIDLLDLGISMLTSGFSSYGISSSSVVSFLLL